MLRDCSVLFLGILIIHSSNAPSSFPGAILSGGQTLMEQTIQLTIKKSLCIKLCLPKLSAKSDHRRLY